MLFQNISPWYDIEWERGREGKREERREGERGGDKDIYNMIGVGSGLQP